MKAGKIPRVTVAILSFNRLHYLRATLESARRCIRYPNLEWIVSDNDSLEPGLKDYLAEKTWLDACWSKTQTHAAAMNEIVARASGDYLILWPEDVQFVVEGDWLRRVVEAMEENPWIGSVGLNFLRRKTLRRMLGPIRLGDAVAVGAEFVRRGRGFRFPRRLTGPCAMATFGWRLPGVIASGIPSLTRVAFWRRLGPWRTTDPSQRNIVDSSLGAEDEMIRRFQDSGERWQQATLMTPVAADIINDALGCKAKIRRGRRYGRYAPPAGGDFYYEILDEAKLPRPGGFPLAFEDVVRPLGFALPLDERGDLVKTAIDTSIVSEIAVGDGK